MMYCRARGLLASAVGTSTSRMPKLPGPDAPAAWAGLATVPVAAASTAVTSMSALRCRRTILLRMSGDGVCDCAGVEPGDRCRRDSYGDRWVPCRGVVTHAGPRDDGLRCARQRHDRCGCGDEHPSCRGDTRGIGGVCGRDGFGCCPSAGEEGGRGDRRGPGGHEEG